MYSTRARGAPPSTRCRSRHSTSRAANERSFFAAVVQPHVPASGHLLYATEGAMRAVRFDAATLEVRGAPVQVLDGVITEANRTASFSVSSSGTRGLHERKSSPRATVSRVGQSRTVVKKRRFGHRDVPTPTRCSHPTTPDRARFAGREFRHLDLEPDAENNDPAHAGEHDQPKSGCGCRRWRRLAFSSVREGVEQPVWQAADGSSPAEPIASDHNTLLPKSFSPDGRWLLVVKACSRSI